MNYFLKGAYLVPPFPTISLKHSPLLPHIPIYQPTSLTTDTPQTVFQLSNNPSRINCHGTQSFRQYFFQPKSVKPHITTNFRSLDICLPSTSDSYAQHI